VHAYRLWPNGMVKMCLPLMLWFQEGDFNSLTIIMVQLQEEWQSQYWS
jgi:hypothetical protein